MHGVKRSPGGQVDEVKEAAKAAKAQKLNALCLTILSRPAPAFPVDVCEACCGSWERRSDAAWNRITEGRVQKCEAIPRRARM